MRSNAVGGWIVVCFGLALIPFNFIFGGLFLTLGIFIVCNKDEDKIEEIKYLKVKRRK